MFISKIETPLGDLHITANEYGVTYIGFSDDHRQILKASELDRSANKGKSNAISEAAAQQLVDYFAGKRKTFDLPLDPAGTEFQQQVWQQLKHVKYGDTASYIDIATAINKPKASRAVGAANGKNPISIVIPCHRIVGSNGTLTGYAGGLDRKSFLLSLEQSH